MSLASLFNQKHTIAPPDTKTNSEPEQQPENKIMVAQSNTLFSDIKLEKPVSSNLSENDVPTMSKPNNQNDSIVPKPVKKITSDASGLFKKAIISTPVNTQTVIEPEEPKPVAVVEESKPVAVVEESKPVAVVEESKPVAVVEEPKPVAVVEESKPVAVVEEPKPMNQFTMIEHLRSSGKLNELKTANQQLLGTVEELNKRLQKLNPSAIKDMEKKYLEKVNKLETTVNAKTLEISDLNDEISKLRKLNQTEYLNKASNLNKDEEIKSRDLQLKEKEEQIGKLELEISSKNNQINQLQDELQEKNKEIARLTILISESNKKVGEQELMIESYKKQLLNSGGESSIILQKKLDELSAEKKKVDEINAKLRQSGSSLEDINLLQTKVSQLTSTVNTLSTQNRMLIHRLSYSGM